MQKDVFNTVLTVIKSALTDAGEFVWIDIDQGQIDNFDNQYPIDFPAALIDVATVEWENADNENQVGDCRVSIRIVLDVPENMNHLSPDTSFASGLNRFAIVQQVYEAIENYNATSKQFTRFTRARQYNEKRPDRLKVVVLEFTTTIWDGRPHIRNYTPNDTPAMEATLDFE